jgi:hypothetical protein
MLAKIKEIDEDRQQGSNNQVNGFNDNRDYKYYGS